MVICLVGLVSRQRKGTDFPSFGSGLRVMERQRRRRCVFPSWDSISGVFFPDPRHRQLFAILLKSSTGDSNWFPMVKMESLGFARPLFQVSLKWWLGLVWTVPEAGEGMVQTTGLRTHLREAENDAAECPRETFPTWGSVLRHSGTWGSKTQFHFTPRIGVGSWVQVHIHLWILV